MGHIFQRQISAEDKCPGSSLHISANYFFLRQLYGTIFENA